MAGKSKTFVIFKIYMLIHLCGMGVGRALIEGVYAAADANGTPSVYWLTQEENTEARKLYDRIAKVTNFIKYGRVEA
jgi:ribosomal protein S18 acetylase RimI-like enzyme|tara:strand:- start:4658 stop:4888 length:231 start_codon:yes stop_codon:yes gene_type:complete